MRKKEEEKCGKGIIVAEAIYKQAQCVNQRLWLSNTLKSKGTLVIGKKTIPEAQDRY